LAGIFDTESQIKDDRDGAKPGGVDTFLSLMKLRDAASALFAGSQGAVTAPN